MQHFQSDLQEMPIHVKKNQKKSALIHNWQTDELIVDYRAAINSKTYSTHLRVMFSATSCSLHLPSLTHRGTEKQGDIWKIFKLEMRIWFYLAQLFIYSRWMLLNKIQKCDQLTYTEHQQP